MKMVDEMAQRCGLRPPEEVARRSGRTTTMLLAALVAMEFGTVAVFGHDARMTRMLHYQVKEMARAAGVTINLADGHTEEQLRGLEIYKIFVDHYQG